MSTTELALSIVVSLAILAVAIYLLRFGVRSIRYETRQARITVEEAAPKANPLDKEYHALGLAQSRISFYFSLFFSAAGFVVIVAAIIIAVFFDRDAPFSEQSRAFITLVAGTIMQAVSALFYQQSNKARATMVEFFDKLRVDQKLIAARELTDAIGDEHLKHRLQTILALNFASVTATNDVVVAILNLN